MVVMQTDRDVNSCEKQEFRVFSVRQMYWTVIVKSFIEIWDYISTGNSMWESNKEQPKELHIIYQFKDF